MLCATIGNVARFDWSYDELVLAAALVADNDWQGLRATNPVVVELSDLLRSAPIHPLDGRAANFRSPSSVQRKTFDIATQHPAYQGAPTRGGGRDAEVLGQFIADRTRMTALAREIRSRIASQPPASPVEDPDVEDPDVEELSAHEGRVLAVTHLRRERDPKLRQAKLAAVLAEGGSIACEVCRFDFHAAYGDLGEGYIEVHHVLPLHASGPVLTRLTDLSLICSNCHRMIHRARPWLTPTQLRELAKGGATTCPEL